MTPFVKSAGGKSWIAPQLAARIASLNPTRYVEPFLGGGSVFLALRQVAPDLPCTLIEAQPDLAAAWLGIQASPGEVWEALEVLKRDTSRAAFLAVRAQQPSETVERAARLIYINKVGFNGLLRTNRAGRINTPYGDGRPRGWSSLAALQQIGAALRGVDLVQGDAIGWLRGANLGRGDVCYADPPYDGTFAGYTVGGFGPAQQEGLAIELRAAADRGAHVVASNRDTARVRDVYSWARIEEASRFHRIGAGNKRRKDGNEVLIGAPGAVLDGVQGEDGWTKADFATKAAALELVLHVNYDLIESSAYSEPDRPVGRIVLEGFCEYFGREFTTFRPAFYALVGGRTWASVDWGRLRDWTGIDWRCPEDR